MGVLVLESSFVVTIQCIYIIDFVLVLMCGCVCVLNIKFDSVLSFAVAVFSYDGSPQRHNTSKS